MEGVTEPVSLSLDEISANLLEKMRKAAEGLEEEKESKMEYSDDEESDEEVEKTKKTEDATRQGC